MIKIEDQTVTTVGEDLEIVSEAGVIMVGVWRRIKERMDERTALAVMINMIKLAIENEKIRTSDILGVLKDMEEINAE